MSEHGNNATPPGPAVAPGVEEIDAAECARRLGERWPGGVDPRVRAVVPGFDAPFFQAGLAGYSDAAMRIVARRHGAPFAVTEALLDRMLLGGGHGFDKADLALMAEALPASLEDQPLAGQIIGSDPDEMAAAAVKMIEQAGRGDKAYRLMAYGDGALPTGTDPRWSMPGAESVTQCATACDEDVCGADGELEVPEEYDPALGGSGGVRAGVGRGGAGEGGAAARLGFATIDVNLACPVKKIDRKQRGGHWLTDPAGAREILRAVRSAVPSWVPCTVKLRRAYDDTAEMARNFEVIFDACYELGYAWTTVHARTVEQKYIGPSRWTFLRDLCARRPDALVFGSGDVWEAADVFRMMAYTGVCGVSVARGCIGNPWIFSQARAMIAGKAARGPTLMEQRRVLEEHLALSVSLSGERAAGRMMRKFAIKLARHHPDPEPVKRAMCAVGTLAEWRSALDVFYRVPAGV